jgi:hypothetical protein
MEEDMKRWVLVLASVAFIGMTWSCASTGQAAQGVDPAADGLSHEEQIFQDIYEEHRGGLIFDGATSYTVRRGDTLVNIARSQYGNDNPYFFPLIMIASTKVVLDPNLLKPGDVLSVPNLKRNLDDPSARAQLKKLMTDFAPQWKGRSVYEADREGLKHAAANL